MWPWLGKQRGLVIEAYFKNVEYVTTTQNAFRTRFGLTPNEIVLDQKTILNRVKFLRTTGSKTPKTSAGRSKSVKTPATIATVINR